jgi:hypothetical protein
MANKMSEDQLEVNGLIFQCTKMVNHRKECMPASVFGNIQISESGVS